MFRTQILMSCLLSLTFVASAHAGPPAPPPAAPAPAPAEAAVNPVEKPIRTLIGAIRFGKFPMAISQMNGEAQGKFLLGDDWAKGTLKTARRIYYAFSRGVCQAGDAKNAEEL